MTGDMLVEREFGKAGITFFLFGDGATARGLAMVTAEICACVMRPVSTIIRPSCSVGFVVNTILFFTLNFFIVLILVVQTATGVFFEFTQCVIRTVLLEC